VRKYYISSFLDSFEIYMINGNPLSTIQQDDFDSVVLRLASPEKIESWSHGEVTEPETINYRTQRSEKDGLFDERIFGPENDYECYCGKYRGIRYKGVTCEKCGVEITRTIVRRQRMGHIDLATVVSHVWFMRGVPSRMALVLGAKISDLEKVIYFSGHIIMDVDEDQRKRLREDLEKEFEMKQQQIEDEDKREELEDTFSETKKQLKNIHEGQIVDDTDFDTFEDRFGSMFESGIGAEAIYQIFRNIDLKELIEKLEKRYQETGSKGKKKKIRKRLSLLRSMREAEVRPEWMFLKTLPVLPPSLRPMVSLEGGRHATSDVNDLYRRVINRNNRLKKLQEINAPHVILRNEKRILQEAVDALLDNSIRRRGTYSSGSSNQRPLKSLADNLKGKQGLFRRNLLGKRVDYSGRSVIIVGADLELDQCGIPKHMALELFRPFVVQRLLEEEHAYNISGGNKLIDEQAEVVWDMLEDAIEDKYVLLNRAPTLHRLGIQAFKPVLIEGRAIQIHPLVCPAFNADFDGDQMAVHVPLSKEAQYEAREIMAADTNLRKPGTGEHIMATGHDIALGCYWMTKIVDDKDGEGKVFESPNAAINAFDYDQVDFRARVKVMTTETQKYEDLDNVFETSVGRLLFNSVLPSDFPYINDRVDTSKLGDINEKLIKEYEKDTAVDVLDNIKDFGFKYATYAGVTWGLDEIQIPEKKDDILQQAEAEADEVKEHYQEGLLSEEERDREIIEIWHEAKSDIEQKVPEALDQNGSVYDMWHSGARGSLTQLTTMAGIKGLIVDNEGETLDFPVTTNTTEGHTPIEYFVSTHGSRKGLTDTALQTAKAGYLTRRLFDVSQDIIVTEEDCGTDKSITITEKNLGGIVVPLSKNIRGRYLGDTVYDEDGDVIYRRNDYLSDTDAQDIEDRGIEAVEVRSPLTCETLRGVCKKCYGRDMASYEPVDLGEAVGTIAAQAVGEPGTQLTMRTFHAGGTASKGGDITQGLPRVEQLFEVRSPDNPAIVSEVSGTVNDVKRDEEEEVIEIMPDEGYRSGEGDEMKTYRVHKHRMSIVEEGEDVEEGQLITDGAADLEELYEHAGKARTQAYIIKEANKVYERQGASISRRHIETIIKQMFSRCEITDSGDTSFTIGDVVELAELKEENNEVAADNGTPAEADRLIKGITQVSLSRKSWLSAASFQHTTRVLIEAATEGSRDELHGLKENVIVGNLIPAGTGFEENERAQEIARLQEEEWD